MKLHFTNEWLRRKIATDPDEDLEAGAPFGRPPADARAEEPRLMAANAAVLSERNVVQLRMALGTLVRQLRRRAGLTIAELAERAQVSEDELRQVEHDPHYTAPPRLLSQLSTFFDVSLANLSQLSGSTQVVDRAFFNGAVQYAAKSDDLSSLTKEEQAALDAFVALLNERAGKS